MVPIKRKNEGGTESVRPEKKRKPSSTAKLSVLKGEEPAFPRGGASILTPLEHKQIQIQAKNDVLFEQITGKKAARVDFEDEENDENNENIPDRLEPPLTKSKSKANPTSKSKKRIGHGAVKEPDVQIEGLGYKVDLSNI